jgi:hypothetical protein
VESFNWDCDVVWCAVRTRLPFLVYLAAEILMSACPESRSELFRSAVSSELSCLSGDVAPRSRIWLGLVFAAALDADVGVFTCVGPLPWVLGLPLGGGGGVGSRGFRLFDLGLQVCN